MGGSVTPFEQVRSRQEPQGFLAERTALEVTGVREGRQGDGSSSGRWRPYGWLLAAVIALPVLAGCGSSEATPTPAAVPTATPAPTPTLAPLFESDSATLALLLPSPTPTPTPAPVDTSRPVVYQLARISMPDCNYELRMGETTAWGYNDPVADARINATVGDGILVTINAGDTLQFDRFENPSRLCLETISIVNEELGLNETLQPDERIEPFEIVFTKAGTFVIDDPAKPGGRGTFVIVVQEAAGAGPVVYELDRISCNPEGAYELRMGEAAAWGYAASDRVSGIEGDGVLVTVNVGDTLSFRRIENPARNCGVPLVVVNEELGLDHTLQPDDRVEPFAITLTKAGTFDITDPAEAGGRGKFVIEVKE